MRRGLLPYCVLAMLRDTERYGFDLVQALGAVGGVTSQGTIYPLLARLRRQGLVGTTWQESAAGPPRRYYQLTSADGPRWPTSPGSGPSSGTASMLSSAPERRT